MTGEQRSAAPGFWSLALSKMATRRGSIVGLCWLGVIGIAAVLAPLLANGHPILMRELDREGRTIRTSSPLFAHLSAVDLALLGWSGAAAVWLLLPLATPRALRVVSLLGALVQAITTLAIATVVGESAGAIAAPFIAIAVGAAFLLMPLRGRRRARLATVTVTAVLCAAALSARWREPLARFDYRQREAAGQVRCVYAPVPFSPLQSDPSRYSRPPGSEPTEGGARSILGTDRVGQDVLSQLLHACRLSIAVGVVSTGLAIAIGLTVGALAGYLGGWVDLLLQRLIEIFMAVPALFLLVVVSGVLPAHARTPTVLMAVMGCVAWTGAARFTRAEFLRLRNQDYIQAARAAGLPLTSVLFRHMLPNGVTPVLVDASFAVAGAVLAEATLSYLGLGPIDQASWGKLLAGATGSSGQFVWWLATFPGLAIFMTVLSCNLIGEALRDAMDPREAAR